VEPAPDGGGRAAPAPGVRARAEDARAEDNKALQVACENGNTELARWLKETFGLTAADTRADGNEALGRACGGHEQAARWLVAAFALKWKDVEKGVCRVMRTACEAGHLGVAEWLKSEFGLTAKNLRDNDGDDILYHTCRAQRDRERPR
jgi:hypothetical protein